MNKFRPQDIGTRYIIKQRLLTGRSENYNWQSRTVWYPAGWKVNKRTIGKQFLRLHYLACHAPKPVQKRWASAYQNFMNRHFSSGGKASMRYLNNHSAHSWL
jgi:hypothetical protein